MRILTLVLSLFLSELISAQIFIPEILPDSHVKTDNDLNQTDSVGNKEGYWCENEGTLRYYSFYKDGKKNGLFRSYEQDGNKWLLLSIGQYVNDKEVGQWQFFEENRVQIKLDNVTQTFAVIRNSNGEQDGYCRDEAYCGECDSGHYRLEYFNWHGKMNGMFRYYDNYDDNWVLRAIGQYRDGIPVGQWQLFHPNGMVHDIVDNLSANTRFTTDSNNEMDMQCYVKRYRKDGKKSAEGWCIFHSSHPRHMILYMKEIGDWIIYRPNGEILHIHY